MFCSLPRQRSNRRKRQRSTLSVTAVLPPSETNSILGIGSLSHLLGQKGSQSINMYMQKSFALSLALDQAYSLLCKPASTMHLQHSVQRQHIIPFLKYFSEVPRWGKQQLKATARTPCLNFYHCFVRRYPKPVC